MGAPASSPTRSVWEIPLSPLPTVFPRMTATMTEATTIAGDARPSLFARLFGRKSKTEDDKTLDKYAADDHSTVPPASMVPPPKPRWSIR